MTSPAPTGKRPGRLRKDEPQAKEPEAKKSVKGKVRVDET